MQSVIKLINDYGSTLETFKEHFDEQSKADFLKKDVIEKL